MHRAVTSVFMLLDSVQGHAWSNTPPTGWAILVLYLGAGWSEHGWFPDLAGLVLILWHG